MQVINMEGPNASAFCIFLDGILYICFKCLGKGNVKFKSSCTMYYMILCTWVVKILLKAVNFKMIYIHN